MRKRAALPDLLVTLRARPRTGPGQRREMGAGEGRGEDGKAGGCEGNGGMGGAWQEAPLRGARRANTPDAPVPLRDGSRAAMHGPVPLRDGSRAAMRGLCQTRRPVVPRARPPCAVASGAAVSRSRPGMGDIRAGGGLKRGEG